MRYRFTGTTEEDFPEPPIARTLQPGDEVDTGRTPIEHARLELIAEEPRPSKRGPASESDPAKGER